jgi:diguanylate cyclase (GGDEF)-like protein/PAS domain S-box-containing protein
MGGLAVKLRRLGVLIPALTLGVFGVTALVATFVAQESAQTQTYRTVAQQARDRILFVRGAGREFLRMGKPSRLQNLISSFASDADLVHIVLVDSDDEVLASNDLGDVGRVWQSLGYGFDQSIVEQVRRLENTKTVEKPQEGYLDVYAGLCGMDSAASLRPSTCGFIGYRVDLRPHLVATFNALRHQSVYYIAGMALVVLVSLVLLRVFVSRRTRAMTSVLQCFGEGQRAVRIPVARRDEIGDLASSINELLDRLVEDEDAVREAHARLNALINNVVDSVIVINDKGFIEDANPATHKIFGYAPREILGQKINVLMPSPMRELHDEYMEHYHRTGEKKIIGIGRQVEAQHKSGRSFPVELTVTEIHVRQQRLYTGILRDISEQVAMRKEMKQAYEDLKCANIELEKQARTDKLTGLYNRRHFDIACMAETLRATRELYPLSLFLIDVDYFKNFNDHYGHPEGDRCLREVAQVLRDVFRRADDIVARYGGEEFAVILANRSQAEAAERAQALLRRVRERAIPHAKSQIAENLTCSIGIVTYTPTPHIPVDPADLVKVADEMLYLAKAQGRNQVQHRLYALEAADMAPRASSLKDS